ncbi:TIGR03619 family F420-dependent LLM class oxidoreductase [Jatrophihabitans sp. DSM 45814]
MALQVSTGLPNCREGRLHPVGAVDTTWLADVAQAAEELDYHSLWLNEFLSTDVSVTRAFDAPPSYYDPIATIAFLAARTAAVRFVPSTVVLPLHEPLLLARQFATLDHLSNGRVTLGVGLGGSAEEFRRLRGDLASPNRGRMLDEYLAALRLLWSEERTASFDGEYVKFEAVEQFPKPLQSPLPIYLAGSADAVLERIAKYGNGWIDTVMSAEAVSAKRDQLRELLTQAGSSVTDPAITRQFYISIASSADEAAKNLAESLPADRPAQSDATASNVVDMSVVGDPDHVGGVLRRYVEAGVTEVCAIFYAPDGAAAMRQMEMFMSEVVPQLVDGA